MTAHQLIADIFARPQQHTAGNMRWITEAQFRYLVDLIGQDEEGAAVKNGQHGGLVWMPSGRWKYVLSHEPGVGKLRDRYSLMKLANLAPSAAGTLFS